MMPSGLLSRAVAASNTLEKYENSIATVTIDGLSANADGLYRLADVDARFAEAMAESDAIEDAATDVPSPARIVPISQGRSYTLGGMQANDSTRGVIVSDNQKVVKR